MVGIETDPPGKIMRIAAADGLVQSEGKALKSRFAPLMLFFDVFRTFRSRQNDGFAGNGVDRERQI